MKHKFLLLQKATVEANDGTLTPAGMRVAHDYAARWTSDSVRDLDAERKYPQLAGLFYDIRSDAQLAREHASEMQKGALNESIVMVRAEVVTVPLEKLMKAGGPYIGPKGGKWADPEHTIPWEEREGGGGAGAKEAPKDKERPAAEATAPKDKPRPAGEEGKPPAGQQELFPGGGEQTPMLKIEHKHVPLRKKPDFAGKRNWVPHFAGMPTVSPDGQSGGTMGAYSLPTRDAQGNRQYIPERQRMHDAIIADALKGKQPVPPQFSPVAIVMMGGAASGKSTLVRKEFEDKGLLQNFVVVNSDDVKEQLPEYEMMTSDPKNTAQDAAAVVHEESSDVAKRLFNQITQPGAQHNLVFDGTGANARNYATMVEKLKQHGYKVHLIFSDVENPDDAVERAMNRADKTGRWVPEDRAREAHGSIPQNFEALAGQVHSYGMYALPKEGGHRKIMSGAGGQHEIHEPEYMSSFRTRAAQYKTAAEQKKAAAGKSPSQPVAKSMTARYHHGEMKKAFPPGQQAPQPGRPQFVMTRPGGQPPAPGHPAAPTPAPTAPPMAAPVAPKPPGMAPAAPPMAQAKPMAPPAAPMPPVAPGAPPGAAGAAPMERPLPPGIDLNAFDRAILEAKHEPGPKGKTAKRTPTAAKTAKPGEKTEKPEDTAQPPVPFPEDDFAWAVEALNHGPAASQPAGQPAARPPGPGAMPAPQMAKPMAPQPAAPMTPPAAPPAQKPPFQKL